MQRNSLKKVLSIAMAAGMTLSLGVCAHADEIVINYPTFQVGSNSAAPVVAELVNEFNEEYAGQYKIVVEDVPGDANYADKIKDQITKEDKARASYYNYYSSKKWGKMESYHLSIDSSILTIDKAADMIIEVFNNAD